MRLNQSSIHIVYIIYTHREDFKHSYVFMYERTVNYYWLVRYKDAFEWFNLSLYNTYRVAELMDVNTKNNSATIIPSISFISISTYHNNPFTY